MYGPGEVLLTTWKTIVKYWELFFQAMREDAIVVDATLLWALFFHHDDELHFASNLPGRTRVRVGPTVRNRGAESGG